MQSYVDSITGTLQRKTSRIGFSDLHEIARTLRRVYKLLKRGDELTSQQRVQMMCAGVASQRAVVVLGEEGGERTAMHSRASHLIFLMLCMAAARCARNGGAHAAWDGILCSWKKTAHAEGLFRDADPSNVAQVMDAALGMQAELLRQSAKPADDSLAHAYYAAARARLEGSLFGDSGGATTATLHFSDTLSRYSAEERENELSFVVSAAEAEAGQAAFRDLLTSFCAPRRYVPTRNRLAPTREASRQLAVECADVVSEAHALAMRGACEVWKHESDPVIKGCALLAGFFLMVQRVLDDEKTPFAGIVTLPFLVTAASKKLPFKLTSVGATGQWVICSANVASGPPTVLYRGSGLAALCDCVLILRHVLLSDVAR